MRIEVPHRSERFGAVRIHGVQEVWELDSGGDVGAPDDPQVWQTIHHVPRGAISQIAKRMAIVIPVKGERFKVLDGVLSGIPHDCLIILVSNSEREPVDRYRMEKETVRRFCRLAQRSALLIHQRDPGLGAAFAEAGMDALLDEDGLVRNGKGEGMLVGLAIAKLSGRSYVGFIDADNYVPGAVYEYVQAYASGFHLAESPHAMVRISWRSKPKIQGGKLFFNRWGRSSQVTNRFLNLLLSAYSGFGTEVIATGNAGEHAISLDLALRMQFAAGFAVEPYEYLNLFERYGGVIPSPDPDVMREGVEVFQIETRNPHFHEDKGSDHVQEMRLQALNVLYHSPISVPDVRNEILDFLRTQGVIAEGEEPPQELLYPPMATLDWDRFGRVLGDKGETFRQIEHVVPTSVQVRTPIPEIPDSESKG
ncbi:MAG: mannosyl-3-phosphoglycerate synthase [Acidimicrobiia bacterium]|nr:mannosyl-3-phosphoglycerate synthase [Acidimicrobiia bacterium]